MTNTVSKIRLIRNRRSADRTASSTDRLQSLPGSGPNDPPLPLRNTGDHVGDQLAPGRTGVDCQVEDQKLAVRFLREPSQQRGEIDHAPAKPVELCDYDHIDLPRLNLHDQGAQARAVERRPAPTFVNYEGGLRPTSSQALLLDSALLGLDPCSAVDLLLGRTPHVADDATYVFHENLHRIRQSHHASGQVAAASSVRFPQPLWMG